MDDDDARTELARSPVSEGIPALDLDGRRLGLDVVEGAPPGRLEAEGTRCRIGSHPSNEIVLDQPTVSRFHCELKVDGSGLRVRDLGSRNGTVIDGVRVEEAWLREGSLLRLGDVVLRLAAVAESALRPLSTRERFGTLVGRSVAMRRAFAMLERCATSEATVLILGETGTGKEGAAEAIHEASERADRPFVVVDCASIPSHLLESELFGHERGSFTGAVERRIGAFEAASTGTVFLDEIGELPLDLQPKLLRVLEQRTVRRIGSNERVPIDVRIIAATHRALHHAVNEGHFRADLYYRLAVLSVELPPLRERPDDLPLLVDTLLLQLGASDARRARLCAPAFVSRLAAQTWPGNVRELRNHLERALIFEGDEATGTAAPIPSAAIDPHLSWGEARTRALAWFESSYLQALLALHGGNVSAAARAAGIDRVHVHRLLRRHGIR